MPLQSRAQRLGPGSFALLAWLVLTCCGVRLAADALNAVFGFGGWNGAALLIGFGAGVALAAALPTWLGAAPAQGARRCARVLMALGLALVSLALWQASLLGAFLAAQPELQPAGLVGLTLGAALIGTGWYVAGHCRGRLRSLEALEQPGAPLDFDPSRFNASLGFRTGQAFVAAQALLHLAALASAGVVIILPLLVLLIAMHPKASERAVAALFRRLISAAAGLSVPTHDVDGSRLPNQPPAKSATPLPAQPAGEPAEDGTSNVKTKGKKHKPKKG